jgi:hypothetical protein
MNTGGYKWYSKDDIASWPEHHKRCRGCDAILPFSEFHRQKQTLFGINNHCKACRLPKSAHQYASKSLERLMVERAKARADVKGVPFDLNHTDITIPEVCPALGIPLYRTPGVLSDNTPSLDRIRPELGYVPENIVVISNKANKIKSDATPDEIMAVALWILDVI